MKPLARLALIAALLPLVACTAPPMRAMTTTGPNCGISNVACVITVSVDNSGLTPKFSVPFDPAIPPSNVSTPISVSWLLPDGYAFYSGDGVSLAGNPAFIDGHIDGFINPPAPPGHAYVWTLTAGSAVPGQKYTLVFHRVNASGPGRMWTCDPVIVSFGGGFTTTPQSSESAVTIACQ